MHIFAYGYGMGYGYGYGGFYWDNTYILILIGAGLCLLASLGVRSTYAKYSMMRTARGITGAQIADRILSENGMGTVRIGRVSGSLSDHFDPRSLTVNLSEGVYSDDSIAAVAVAAHECGHVLQHRDGYFPYTLRHALVPVVNFGSSISWILIIAGIFLGGAAKYETGNGMGYFLIQLGIICFSAAVLFQFVTLPVEFNASRRALKILKSSNNFSESELRDARKVLTAAAMTYVAGTVSSVLQLLRLIILFGGRRRD